ncbi:hypothetical protein SSS_05864 [Sarcoptes scabiei]|uniref:Uncharacterized protein n=1 Tax=Sarcoptes scabiei TaxID=52283 RepID=A0A834R8Z1_SARSC|nr:hypothetical protein SSS_05864 [Sarcoptes scabiei]
MSFFSDDIYVENSQTKLIQLECPFFPFEQVFWLINSSTFIDPTKFITSIETVNSSHLKFIIESIEENFYGDFECNGIRFRMKHGRILLQRYVPTSYVQIEWFKSAVEFDLSTKLLRKYITTIVKITLILYITLTLLAFFIAINLINASKSYAKFVYMRRYENDFKLDERSIQTS